MAKIVHGTLADALREHLADIDHEILIADSEEAKATLMLAKSKALEAIVYYQVNG